MLALEAKLIFSNCALKHRARFEANIFLSKTAALLSLTWIKYRSVYLLNEAWLLDLTYVSGVLDQTSDKCVEENWR